MAPQRWHPINNEAVVEMLLPAIQQAIADTCAADQSLGASDQIPVAYADLSSVLLMLLATIMEPLPECSTPQGIRLMAEAASKELASLIRDTRRLKQADEQAPSGPH